MELLYLSLTSQSIGLRLYSLYLFDSESNPVTRTERNKTSLVSHALLQLRPLNLLDSDSVSITEQIRLLLTQTRDSSSDSSKNYLIVDYPMIKLLPHKN